MKLIPEFETYFRWLPNEKYKIYPAFALFTGKDWEIIRAEPARNVQFKGEVTTGSATVTKVNDDEFGFDNLYEVRLEFSINEDLRKSWRTHLYGFNVGTDPNDLTHGMDYHKVYTNTPPYDTNFYSVFRVRAEPGTTYYYCAYVDLSNNPPMDSPGRNYKLDGGMKSFTIPDNE